MQKFHETENSLEYSHARLNNAKTRPVTANLNNLLSDHNKFSNDIGKVGSEKRFEILNFDNNELDPGPEDLNKKSVNSKYGKRRYTR